jgi:hypothetical protein
MVVGRLSFAILLRLRNKRYASARLNTSILVPSQIKPRMRISYASFHRKRCSKRCWQQYSAKVLRGHVQLPPPPLLLKVAITRIRSESQK